MLTNAPYFKATSSESPYRYGYEDHVWPVREHGCPDSAISFDPADPERLAFFWQGFAGLLGSPESRV
jgi:hypothetical protein